MRLSKKNYWSGMITVEAGGLDSPRLIYHHGLKIAPKKRRRIREGKNIATLQDKLRN